MANPFEEQEIKQGHTDEGDHSGKVAVGLRPYHVVVVDSLGASDSSLKARKVTLQVSHRLTNRRNRLRTFTQTAALFLGLNLDKDKTAIVGDQIAVVREFVSATEKVGPGRMITVIGTAQRVLHLLEQRLEKGNLQRFLFTHFLWRVRR